MIRVGLLREVRLRGESQLRAKLEADSKEELILFASSALRISDKNLYEDKKGPYFELTKSKREAAIQAGAIAVDAQGVRLPPYMVRKDMCTCYKHRIDIKDKNDNVVAHWCQRCGALGESYYNDFTDKMSIKWRKSNI